MHWALAYEERFGDSPPFWAVGDEAALHRAIRENKPLEELVDDDAEA